MFGVLIGAAAAVAVPAAAASPTPASDVMIEPGAGWTIVAEEPGALGMLERTYQGGNVQLVMIGLPVTTPPGVQALFEGMSNFPGFDSTPEPELGMAAWMVPEGAALDNGTFAILSFATKDHIFTFTLENQGSEAVDVRSLLRDLARRQIDAAGGPAQSRQVTRQHREAESEVIAPPLWNVTLRPSLTSVRMTTLKSIAPPSSR